MRNRKTPSTNNFYAVIVGNLKISDYSNCDPLTEVIAEPALKAIVKYRNQPNIVTLREICKKSLNFLWFIRMKIKLLKNKPRCIKNIQGFSILSKMITKNAKILTDFPHSSYSRWMMKVTILPAPRVTKISDKIIDKSAYFQIFQKVLSDAWFFKFIPIPMYKGNNVSLE